LLPAPAPANRSSLRAWQSWISSCPFAEAEPLYRRALDIREKALGRDHPDVAVSLNNLAELYQSQGRYAEVEPLLQRSLVIREKALSRDHPDVASALNNLAELYRNQGRYRRSSMSRRSANTFLSYPEPGRKRSKSRPT
jgi:tetratricopeptide (TPR) repeat protein